MSQYRAFRVDKDANKQFHRSIVELDTNDLPAGDLLIDVHYSSLNYKDALSATGSPGVTRNFPHTPGIDAAGIIIESGDSAFQAGDEVICIGFDLGMGTAGGYGERIRVPAGWVVPKPAGLSLREAMIIGTAGFTAAVCVHKLEAMGLTPKAGPVLVTGASGGVGSVAVLLLASLGYEVCAVTGKASAQGLLGRLGANQFMTREQAADNADKPLLPETWAGVVDTVGGEILVNGLKSLKYAGSLASCGLVASPRISATVLPFILRHVNLLGVDSVQLPLQQKAEIWQKLATSWRLDALEQLVMPITLDTLSEHLDKILAGEMIGRGLVSHHAAMS